jgi:DNA-binding response OmpR family regulator
MPKRILLIDPDEPFTQGLAAAATAAGFKASTASDSEKGMALAKQENPDLIVVCVEAQPTNGYMLCTRLKKDDRLRAIPVILTSANATPDSFEKHKKLKTRAEDYLIKPFAPQAMLQKVSQLLGVPANGAGADESLGLGELMEGEDEPIQLGEADVAEAHGTNEEAIDIEELEELDIEEDPATPPAPPAKAVADEDLAMFDEAFDALKPSAGGAPKPRKEAPAPRKESPARAPAATIAPSLREGREPTELSAPSDDEMLGLTDDAELAIEPEEPAAPVPRAKQPDPFESLEALGDKDHQLNELQAEVQKLKDEASKRDAATKTLQQRADSFAAAAKKFERELTTAREDAKAGASKADLTKLKEELEHAREEIAALNGEKDLLREEQEELRKQLVEAQGLAKQNEQRAVKAYQKLKTDEKLREKTRKALQIALALLDDVTIEPEGDSDKESA